MNTPPFLLGAAALFWGVQSGNWLIALASAVLLEAPRYSARRWQLETEQFIRVADFCTVLIVALALYLYFTFGNPRAITLLFQWMPVIVLPLALAQAWSTTRALDLAVLFWSMRRYPMRRPVTFNSGYPMFALWLLAASAANHRGAGFYPGLIVLVAWPLLRARPRSYATPVAAGMLIAAALAGYAGQSGLHLGQQWLEAAATDWLAGGGSRTDPYRSTTDIGSLGELKLSQRILLRVESDPSLRAPILLHRASYDTYFRGTWIARNARFSELRPVGNASSWDLGSAHPAGAQLVVHDMSDGNPVLSLPERTVRIEGLAASEMKTNALGAVQVEHKPGFFSYRALVGSAESAYGAPTPRDLAVPPAEAAVVAQIAAELGLARLPPSQALARVGQYFAGNFEYALWQGARDAGRTPLADFLLSTRAGHCEYFASATALLLRAAGIPARYATGFSVQEWSALDRAYVVRERHAHAWTRAWVDGAWQDLDTTPAGWFDAEAARTPFWSPLADLWSWSRFRLATWSAKASEQGWSPILMWIALPLIFWLAWRTLSGRRADIPAGGAAHDPARVWPGQDSEFYLIEARLAQLGFARGESEALTEWLTRIEGTAGQDINSLQELARLHSRYRFDPAGLSADERVLLRARALSWLAQHAAAPA